jgi:multisubunit Na+/H+ antiporter MnhE subunit
VRRATSLLTWFVLLLGLWELLVGTFQRTEVLAGLIAAAIGTAFVVLLGELGLLRFSLDLVTALRVAKLVWQLPVELCVVTWVLVAALARGRRVRGSWVRVPFPQRARETGRGQRALAATAGTATPNAIVVEIVDGEALLHSLAPSRPGGRSVL